MNQWQIRLPQLPQAPDICLPSTGICVIFGGSGCGKTRLLRALAGLDQHTGKIQFNDQIWLNEMQSLSPRKRNISIMFQESRLLPHKSVHDNIFLGQAVSDQGKLFDALELTPLLHLTAGELSGGEQRRCALARALVHKGQALFLDEPLTGLDQTRRANAIELIRAEGKRRAVLLITHQLDELLQLANHLILMNQTQLIEGELTQLINHPILVHQRGHAFSILCGKVTDTSTEFTVLELDDGQHIRLVGNQQIDRGIAIDARDVSISLSQSKDSSILNIVKTQILSLEQSTPSHATLTLALGQQRLRALLSTHSINKLKLAPGQWVYAQIKGTVQL